MWGSHSLDSVSSRLRAIFAKPVDSAEDDFADEEEDVFRSKEYGELMKDYEVHDVVTEEGKSVGITVAKPTMNAYFEEESEYAPVVVSNARDLPATETVAAPAAPKAKVEVTEPADLFINALRRPARKKFDASEPIIKRKAAPAEVPVTEVPAEPAAVVPAADIPVEEIVGVTDIPAEPAVTIEPITVTEVEEVPAEPVVVEASEAEPVMEVENGAAIEEVPAEPVAEVPVEEAEPVVVEETEVPVIEEVTAEAEPVTAGTTVVMALPAPAEVELLALKSEVPVAEAEPADEEASATEAEPVAEEIPAAEDVAFTVGEYTEESADARDDAVMVASSVIAGTDSEHDAVIETAEMQESEVEHEITSQKTETEVAAISAPVVMALPKKFEVPELEPASSEIGCVQTSEEVASTETSVEADDKPITDDTLVAGTEREALPVIVMNLDRDVLFAFRGDLENDEREFASTSVDNDCAFPEDYLDRTETTFNIRAPREPARPRLALETSRYRGFTGGYRPRY